MKTPLEPPDSLHLKAAEGWLELGNPGEATAELDRITVALLVHPDVLELRWQINALAAKWETCLEIAAALTKAAPERAIGWIHLSVALHKLHRTKEAWDTLSPFLEQFPRDPVVAYDLACYACQLGDLPRAERLLTKAFELDFVDKAFQQEKANHLRRVALEDPDLEPLWNRITNL